MRCARVVTAPHPWCTHRLTVDDVFAEPGPGRIIRACLTCGGSYDRSRILDRLAELIRERHRLPPSPWTADERAADPW